MIKEYAQRFTLQGDELEAIWVHEPQSDIPEVWTLQEVEGLDSTTCPDEIWEAAEKEFDPSAMTEVHPDMDFEGMIEEEERLKNGW